VRTREKYAPHGISFFKSLGWARAFLSIAKAQGWRKRGTMGLRGYNNPRQFSDVLSGQDCTLRERTKAGVYTQNHSVVSVMGTCTDAWRGIRSYLAAYARHPDCRNRSNHHRSQNHV